MQPIRPIELLIILGVCAVGLIYYWRIVMRARTKPTFANFFLGGRRIGSSGSENGTWGLCFAFANAIWYYAYLGYNYGFVSFWLQIPWSISIIVFGYYIANYLKATREGTVHEYLGNRYGGRVRVIACIATTIGYVLNCGFETFYSGFLLSKCFHLSEASILIGGSIAIACSLFCVTAGFSGNIENDKPQNKIATAGCALLVVLLAYSIFTSKGTSIVSGTIASLSYTKHLGLDMILGVVVFTFFFNFVDMANWQIAAGNSDAPSGDLPAIRRSYYISAGLQIIAPAIVGSCIGALLHYYATDIQDEDLIKTALELTLPTTPAVLRGLLFGFVILGFLSATLSSIGNYFLAAVQTLNLDLFRHAEYRRIRSIENTGEREIAEELFIKKVSRTFPLMAIGSVAIFGFLYHKDPSRVFAYQFIMYGAAISLFPSLLYALWKQSRGQVVSAKLSLASALGILFGVISAVTPFAIMSWFDQSALAKRMLTLVPAGYDASFFQNCAPMFSLASSTMIFIIGVAYVNRKEGNHATTATV